MIKKRRCLKFTGYIFVPNKIDINDKGAMKYFVGKMPGRIQLFDDDGKKVGGKMKAFITLGQLVNIINNQFLTMWRNRFKKI